MAEEQCVEVMHIIDKNAFGDSCSIPNQNVGGESDPDTNQDVDRESDPDTNQTMGEESDPDTNQNMGGESDPNTNRNMGGESDPNTNQNMGGESDPNTNRNMGGESDPNTNRNPGRSLRSYRNQNESGYPDPIGENTSQNQSRAPPPPPYEELYYSTDVDGQSMDDRGTSHMTMTTAGSEGTTAYEGLMEEEDPLGYDAPNVAPGPLLGEEEEVEDEVEEDYDDMHEDNAFGYQFRSYLSGSPLINAFLTLWHLTMLVFSAALLLCGTLVYFFFSALVIRHVTNLRSFPTYKQFMNTANEKTTEIEFTRHPKLIGMALLCSHGLYLFSHFLYVTYGIHKIQFTLPIGALITSGVAGTETFMTSVILYPTLVTSEEERRELIKSLENYKVSSNISSDVSYDYISVLLECCGISDKYDFDRKHGLFYFEKRAKDNKKTQVPIQIAPTCCSRKVFEEGIRQVETCATTGTENNEKGCLELVHYWICKGKNYYAIVIWVHLVDCFFHSYLYKKKVSVFSRMMDYKSESKDQMLEFLMKQRLKREMFEMTSMLSGAKKQFPVAMEKLHM